MNASSGIEERIAALDAMVGDTPMLALDLLFRGRRRVVYVKVEYLNLTGSIKDRMALHVIRRAYRDGTIRSGDTIAEATSGNSGIAFSAIGRALRHPVLIFMPDWMSQERSMLIRSFGAGGLLGKHRAVRGFVSRAARCLSAAPVFECGKLRGA
jgi:cysteine synthase A